jgi:hypothetical protein
MAHRRYIMLAAFLAMVLAGGAAVWLAMLPSELERKFAAIQIGMSPDEVVSILGRPPDWAWPGLPGDGVIWQMGNDTSITVILSRAEGRVLEKELRQREVDGPLDRLRAWFGLAPPSPTYVPASYSPPAPTTNF